jgi:DNA polymerase-1
MGLRVPTSPPSTKFPGGQVKTDRDTLQNSGDELLEALGDGGPIATVYSTFLPTLRAAAEAPVNTKFRLLATGRISSAQPNCNNIPRTFWTEDQRKATIEVARSLYLAGDFAAAQARLDLLELDVRPCIVPRPGFLLASVDYDCAELRALAQVCLWLFGRSRMAEFFQNDPDGDPHLELAANELRITYEEAMRRKKAGDRVIKNLRQNKKAVSFGFPGGLGPDKFMLMARKNYGAIFTRPEAKRNKQQWLQRWPEMRLYFDLIDRVTGGGRGKNGTVEQLRPGRQPHRVRGKVGYTDGCNTLFQGLIADAASHALWNVSRECYVDETSPLFGSRPVIFLYDEIIAEVPIDRAHAAAHRLRDVMVSSAREWIPDVPVTASPALMTNWHKSAEPVYVDGKLVPWQPKRVTLDDLAIAA